MPQPSAAAVNKSRADSPVLWFARPRSVPDLLQARPRPPDRPVGATWSTAGAARPARLADSPIDLIPEFTPVFGPLDDILVAMLVLRATCDDGLGAEELRRRWPGTADGLTAPRQSRLNSRPDQLRANGRPSEPWAQPATASSMHSEGT
jgi:hypothetical protein